MDFVLIPVVMELIDVLALGDFMGLCLYVMLPTVCPFVYAQRLSAWIASRSMAGRNIQHLIVK